MYKNTCGPALVSTTVHHVLDLPPGHTFCVHTTGTFSEAAHMYYVNQVLIATGNPQAAHTRGLRTCLHIHSTRMPIKVGLWIIVLTEINPLCGMCEQIQFRINYTRIQATRGTQQNVIIPRVMSYVVSAESPLCCVPRPK